MKLPRKQESEIEKLKAKNQRLEDALLEVLTSDRGAFTPEEAVRFVAQVREDRR